MAYSQRIRKQIINQMMKYVAEIRDANKYKQNEFPIKDEIAVIRLTMLQFGCTRKKASEYMDLIFDRDPRTHEGSP